MHELLRDVDKGLLFEYKKLLLGNSQKFSLETFNKSAAKDQETAIKIFRFAVEVFLRWSPDMTYEMMDGEIIDKMKLKAAFDHIIYPSELNKTSDYWYIACLLYPHKFPYDEEENVVRIYDGVLDVIRHGGRYKFPKNFFSGPKGRDRACMCLRRFIQLYGTFHDAKELYRYFSTIEGINALDSHGLKGLADSIFVSPVEFVHTALPDNMKDELYYHYYTFQWAYREQKRSTVEVNYIGYHKDDM